MIKMFLLRYQPLIKIKTFQTWRHSMITMRTLLYSHDFDNDNENTYLNQEPQLQTPPQTHQNPLAKAQQRKKFKLDEMFEKIQEKEGGKILERESNSMGRCHLQKFSNATLTL